MTSAEFAALIERFRGASVSGDAEAAARGTARCSTTCDWDAFIAGPAGDPSG